MSVGAFKAKRSFAQRPSQEIDLSRTNEFTEQPRSAVAVTLSIVFWLVSVALAALSPFALRDVLVWAMALVIPQPDQYSRLRTAQSINVASQCGTAIFGVLAVVVMVFCTEAFFHHAGQPRLLRRLAWVIAAECLLIIPVALFFWRF